MLYNITDTDGVWSKGLKFPTNPDGKQEKFTTIKQNPKVIKRI